MFQNMFVIKILFKIFSWLYIEMQYILLMALHFVTDKCMLLVK